MPSLPAKTGASLASLVGILRRPIIRVGLTTILLVVAAHFASFTYIRPFLETVPQFDITQISAILLAFGIGGFFGNILGGLLAERSTRIALALTSSALSIATLTLFAFGALPSLAILGTVVWGLAFGAVPVSARASPRGRRAMRRKAPVRSCSPHSRLRYRAAQFLVDCWSICKERQGA